MDKASVLGDAIKYLKQLQEQVKTLEEQSRKKSIESVVYVKKFELHSDPANSNTHENFSGSHIDEPHPEIEARVSDKDVLIRIHCEKRKGILEKTIGEIEKHHLSVINSSIMTFGNYALDITIIAQVIFYLLYKDSFLSKLLIKISLLLIISVLYVRFVETCLNFLQMDEGFSVTMKDLVKNLHLALKFFI